MDGELEVAEEEVTEVTEVVDIAKEVVAVIRSNLFCVRKFFILILFRSERMPNPIPNFYLSLPISFKSGYNSTT